MVEKKRLKIDDKKLKEAFSKKPSDEKNNKLKLDINKEKTTLSKEAADAFEENIQSDFRETPRMQNFNIGTNILSTSSQRQPQLETAVETLPKTETTSSSKTVTYVPAQKTLYSPMEISSDSRSSSGWVAPRLRNEIQEGAVSRNSGQNVGVINRANDFDQSSFSHEERIMDVETMARLKRGGIFEEDKKYKDLP